jgi:hypothetical protein
MFRRLPIVVLILLSLVACTGSSAPEIPGLDPNEEVELVVVEPAPSNDSYVWTTPFRSATYPR